MEKKIQEDIKNTIAFLKVYNKELQERQTSLPNAILRQVERIDNWIKEQTNKTMEDELIGEWKTEY